MQVYPGLSVRARILMALVVIVVSLLLLMLADDAGVIQGRPLGVAFGVSG